MLRGRAPQPRHRDGVQVLAATVSATGEEAFECAARSIEKYLTNPRPVPVLLVDVFESPELARQRRDRTSHLAQGIHIDAKLAPGEALAMGRKHLDLFRQRFEPSEFRDLHVPRSQHNFFPGAMGERAFQPRTPNGQLALDGSQRAVGKHGPREQIQEIRQRQVNCFTIPSFPAAACAGLVLLAFRRSRILIHRHIIARSRNNTSGIT
ncbi:MAG: hypothetical protein JO121_09500 [Deltaproteobacteria bacterium]|nr:hypothetical protein [Deltaproteobacteria bacterium]